MFIIIKRKQAKKSDLGKDAAAIKLYDEVRKVQRFLNSEQEECLRMLCPVVAHGDHSPTDFCIYIILVICCAVIIQTEIHVKIASKRGKKIHKTHTNHSTQALWTNSSTHTNLSASTK